MIDPKTLSRTTDPQTSKDAAKKIVESGELSRQEKEVLYIIKIWHSDSDFTTKDVAVKMLGYPYHKAYDICRKRFSGLENKGKIEPIQRTVNVGGKIYKVTITKSGKPAYKRRDGCRVWKVL